MKNHTLYLATIAIWGSTWFAIEFQLGSVPPILSVVYRYALASTLLFLWCRIRGISVRFPLRSHLWFAGLGTLLFGVSYVLAYSAQQYISSALAAILFATVLWINVLNKRIFFGTRITARTLGGAVLGVSGVAVLFAPQVDSVSLSDGVFLGALLSLTGCLLASLGNMVSQGAQGRGLPVIPSNAWGMLYGALVTALLATAQGHRPVFDWSIEYVGSLFYLAVFGSIIAFCAYLTLLGRIGAERAGYAVVASPVVALLLSSLFEGLEITPSILLGTALVLAGNLFVLRQGRRAGRKSQPSRPALSVRSLLHPDPQPLRLPRTLESTAQRARTSLRDPRIVSAPINDPETQHVCPTACPTH